ncbi:MAG TPA: prepilin peptidase [Pirellulales bacterium]|jgi:leader peptidase (prepilin peptidase)/N-methyltransferase|nr:prepilin peptidase [Pirellulales bacterium]
MMDPIIDWIVRLDWILVAWLFALGGVVGSFLNVVAYRLPAGRSIAHPGSCCPACGHPIRWYHNLPIVSWLILGGRCYDCRAKISPRYPLVELATAILFVAVFAANVRPRIALPANPERSAAMPTGFDIVIRYAGDLWLLCTLFCAALIELDGARAPRRVFWAATLVGLIAAGVFPAARQEGPAWRGLAIAAAGSIAGWATGHILAVVANAMALRRDYRSADNDGGPVASLSLACTGAILGWAAAIAVGMFAGIALIAARRLKKPQRSVARLGWSTFVLIGGLAWILAARFFPPSIPLAPGN